MEHIELHVIENTKDFELAVISGLIEEEVLITELSCDLCQELVYSRENATLNATIVLNDKLVKVSCDSCLTDAVSAVILE
jgi:formylmethanofuran dehydrogenase subunit E